MKPPPSVLLIGGIGVAGVACTVILLLASCSVPVLSLSPPFPMEDAIFEESLLGEWYSPADGPDTTFLFLEKLGNEGYRLTHFRPESEIFESPGDSMVFGALLGQVDGGRYMSLTPLWWDKDLLNPRVPRNDLLFPHLSAHLFSTWRIQLQGDSLTVEFLSYGGVEDLLEKDPEAIPHAVLFLGDDEGFILSSGPARFGEFLRSADEAEDLWEGKMVFHRKVGS